MKAKKDNVSYVDFTAKKKVFRKIEYQWDEIRRACNHNKFLGCKAVNILSNAIHRLEKEEVITYTHSYITKHFTRTKYEQNNNILDELNEVLDIKFNRSGTANGKKYRDRFEVRKNKNTDRILENPTLFYSTQKPVEPLINSDSQRGKKLSVVSEKIQTALHIYREEEIEEIAYSYLSSISDVKGIKECVYVNNETSPDAALPLTGSSTGEFLSQPRKSQATEPTDPVKAAKPRLVITAAMQQGTVPMPLLPQARGLASDEVGTAESTSSTPPPTLPPVPPLVPPVTPPPAMTTEEEQEQFRQHRTRQQEAVSDKPKPLGATILSLLPKLGLEDELTTKIYQKGVDFQLEVENSKACGTTEQGISPKITEKTGPEADRFTAQLEPEAKPNGIDAEFQRVLAEKTERNAVWQGVLSRVTGSMGEIHDPLSGKMREVTLEDIQGQFGNMNYKVDLEAKRIRLKAKSELWIPAFELVWLAKFKEVAAEVGYSFELVRTLEEKQ